MNATARGILTHHFHAEYWCAIGLEFETSDIAASVLPVLGHGWSINGKEPTVLVWAGNSNALLVCKTMLASYGADPTKIDSIKTSVDHGEWFEISIPLPPSRTQLQLQLDDTAR